MIIENAFDVDADPDRVFGFLQNPHNVATCFPGAELTEDLGDDQYRGKVKIKLGPVTAAFSGTARIPEKDDVARIAVLVAEGKDTRGSGTAKATATMRVEPKEDGAGSSVLLRTDLTISGRLAQFGRGIMADVSGRMVGDLATRVRERIESEPEPAAVKGDAAEPAVAGSGAAPDAAAPVRADTAAGSATPEATGAAEPAAEPAADSGAVSGATTGTATEEAPRPGTETGSAPGTESHTGSDGQTPTGAATESAPETSSEAAARPAGEAPKAPAATAAPKAPARPAAEPDSAIKASTLLKVMISGMFRRLFARLRGRSAESRDG